MRKTNTGTEDEIALGLDYQKGLKDSVAVLECMDMKQWIVSKRNI